MRGAPSSQLVIDFRGPQSHPTPHADARNYRAAFEWMGGTWPGMGSCPIEAGFLGNLVDFECAHGLMPGERTCCP